MQEQRGWVALPLPLPLALALALALHPLRPLQATLTPPQPLPGCCVAPSLGRCKVPLPLPFSPPTSSLPCAR